MFFNFFYKNMNDACAAMVATLNQFIGEGMLEQGEVQQP